MMAYFCNFSSTTLLLLMLTQDWQYLNHKKKIRKRRILNWISTLKTMEKYIIKIMETLCMFLHFHINFSPSHGGLFHVKSKPWQLQLFWLVVDYIIFVLIGHTPAYLFRGTWIWNEMNTLENSIVTSAWICLNEHVSKLLSWTFCRS